MSQEAAFSDSVLDKIGIGSNQNAGRAQYEWSQETERTRVLLPIPRSAAEENGACADIKVFIQRADLPDGIPIELHETVMASLRKRVEALEEEELFESSMKQFTQRSSMTVDATGAGGGGGLVAASGNMMTHLSGEPNAAGLGDQPQSRNVRELLRADVRETLARERNRERETRTT